MQNLTPDRTKQPKMRELDTFSLPEYSILYLDNQIPVILFHAGEQEVTKLDFVFHAGSWHQSTPMVAPATAELLTAGTKQHTSQEIAAQTDYYGAYLINHATPDYAVVTLFTLNKYLEQMNALTEEVIKHPSFPPEEIETHLRNQKHQMQVSEQKVDYLARTRFNSYLYGASHPYGRYLKEDYFANINQDSLKQFHKSHYHSGNGYIVASGKLPAQIMPLLNRHFGGSDWNGTSVKTINHIAETSQPGLYNVPKKDAVQSAIRMGKTLFTRNHPDFQAMKVVNTVLGGYFGSRLMKNIREEKGYTYGIYSSVQSMLHEGSFFISAETGKEVTDKAIEEIFKELEKLQSEKVGAEELNTVKSYMLGSVLKMVDGAFAAADFYRTLYHAGLDERYFYDFIQTIKTIDAEKIRTLAQKYLKKEDFIQVIAG